MGGVATKCCHFTCCFGSLWPYRFYGSDAAKAKRRTPSCWPCASTALYMRIADADDPDTLRGDAEALFNAMSGCGTDEAELIRVLANRSAKQIKAIADIFEKEFGKGKTLVQWLQSDTSGDFERITVAAASHGVETDAEALRDAIKGLGTDDDTLIYLLASRSNAQLQRIAEEYQKRYNKSLVSDVLGDTSGHYADALKAILGKADYLALRLKNAVDRIGTDDSRLVRILCNVPRSHRIYREMLQKYDDPLNCGFLNELEYECSMPDLQDVKEAYQRLFKTTLQEDIASDTSGQYRMCLMELLKDPDQSLAENFKEVQDAKLPEDPMLIELCTTRSKARLAIAGQVYKKTYDRSLEKDVAGMSTGNYENTLTACLQSLPDLHAEALFEAFKGLGTDDDEVVSIMTGKSRKEIKDMMAAFQAKYDKTLEDSLRSETSFWYRRMLVYIIRQATENLQLVRVNQLLRIRDV